MISKIVKPQYKILMKIHLGFTSPVGPEVQEKGTRYLTVADPEARSEENMKFQATIEGLSSFMCAFSRCS